MPFLDDQSNKGNTFYIPLSHSHFLFLHLVYQLGLTAYSSILFLCVWLARVLENH